MVKNISIRFENCEQVEDVKAYVYYDNNNELLDEVTILIPKNENRVLEYDTTLFGRLMEYDDIVSINYDEEERYVEWMEADNGGNLNQSTMITPVGDCKVVISSTLGKQSFNWDTLHSLLKMKLNQTTEREMLKTLNNLFATYDNIEDINNELANSIEI